MNVNETCAAVSTPYGRGGIAVIRVSGENAIPFCERVFRPMSGKVLSAIPDRTSVYGQIFSEGDVIDDGMATVFRAPHSYTGEDTVELSCHGGILITELVLRACFLAGCVQAGPGEFTKRAFLNGKLGLSQAESIIDLIDAQSTEQVRLAGAGARGVLSREAEALHGLLKEAISSTYAFIDFPDEDLTDLSIGELTDRVSEIVSRFTRLADSYSLGRVIGEGIRCAIIGKPNTGKSSLLNALSNENRAIVTDIAGTTRDVIEETVSVGKILLRLLDTAGIRETEDTVEALGVERSVSAMEQADLIYAVYDVSKPFTEEDFALTERLRHLSVPVIAVENKCDLARCESTARLDLPFADTVTLSARNGDGIDALRVATERLFIRGTVDYRNDAVLTNARQYAAVRGALSHAESALSALRNGYTQDIACMDLELAMSALGEVDGRTVTGEIVDSIFHNFCVGK